MEHNLELHHYHFRVHMGSRPSQHPGPNEKWIIVASRRVGITIMAMIAPELVIMWAIRQWMTARK